MDRNEILNKLHTLRFCVFWPDNWEDIGFTERPIWINSYGYGYVACDEPCNFATIENMAEKEVQEIKHKANQGSLKLTDIAGTPFDEIYWQDDEEYFKKHLGDFATLPDKLINGTIYCEETFDGWTFYNTEEALIEGADRKDNFWGGSSWEELSDALLEIWIKRIDDLGENVELPFSLGIYKDK